MTTREEHLQQFNLGAEVELWSIVGPSVGLNLVSSGWKSAGEPVFYGGTLYQPGPIEGEGFDLTTDGKQPQPIVRVGNATGYLNAAMAANRDFLGFEVTRTLVFERFLDGQTDADPNAWHRRDVYEVAQRTSLDPITFRLRSRLDQAGRKIPARPVLKNICPRRYREWRTSTFVYFLDEGGCPYNGTDYYDAQGNPALTPEEDRCSKLLTTGCTVRYGNGDKPWGAFPAIGEKR